MCAAADIISALRPAEAASNPTTHVSGSCDGDVGGSFSFLITWWTAAADEASALTQTLQFILDAPLRVVRSSFFFFLLRLSYAGCFLFFLNAIAAAAASASATPGPD